MKKFLSILVLFFCLSFFGCKTPVNVNIVDENNNVIFSFEINKGSDFDLSTVKAETGFYYTFDKTNDDLKNIKSDTVIVGVKHEETKDITYIIDGKVVLHKVVSYSEDVDLTEIEKLIENLNYSWRETLEIKDHVYYSTYELVYEETNFYIYFYYHNAILEVVELPYGSRVEIPESLQAKDGYYYDFDESNEDLSFVKNNMDVSLVKLECPVKSLFYIDQELVKEVDSLYFEKIENPTVPNYMINIKWNMTETLDGNEYRRVYNLEYEVKNATISYYDGAKRLDLEPATYRFDDNFDFPIPKKEGYEFIGWFLSEKSLSRYTNVSECSNDDIELFARFIQTANFEKVALPDGLHFTGINKIPSGNNFNYIPVFPDGAPSTSVQDYDFDTVDHNIAIVSVWSSISGQNAGYTILKATLKSDPRVVISSFIRVAVDGIYFATESEVNNIEQCTVTFVDNDDNILLKQVIFKGSSVIPPTPPVIDGLMFNGWDHDVYGINSDITIKATYVEGNNPFVGKKIAIIGDSI